MMKTTMPMLDLKALEFVHKMDEDPFWNISNCCSVRAVLQEFPDESVEA
jgi:hypothetical protein